MQKFTLENPRRELKVVSIEPFWFPELNDDSNTNIKFLKEEDLSEVWVTPKKINHEKSKKKIFLFVGIFFQYFLFF